jgi:hypothetical protein
MCGVLQVGDDLQKLATAAVEDVGRFDEFVTQRNAQRDEKRRMWYAQVDQYTCSCPCGFCLVCLN